MNGVENQELSELDKTVSCIFSDFMTKITKYDEMVSMSSNLLIGFHQHIEMLRRPALDKTSQVVDNVLKANQTERVKAYVQSGCRNVHDGIQNITKLNTCHRGLQDHLNKAKCVINELEMLIDDVSGVLETERASKLQCEDEGVCDGSLHLKEEIDSTAVKKPEVSDYAAMMAMMFSMLTQDFSMQEKIICSLNLNSLPGELESYCLMWSLRPFINDDVMHHAWELI